MFAQQANRLVRSIGYLTLLAQPKKTIKAIAIPYLELCLIIVQIK